MTERQKFPWRRPCTTLRLMDGKTEYAVSYGELEDKVGEIFISSSQPGSASAECARDGALLASIALQRGATLDDLAHSVTRESDGVAATVIGAAIDLVAVASK